MVGEPAFSEPGGKGFAQGLESGGGCARRVGKPKGSRGELVRCEVDGDAAAGLPEGGDLEGGGPAETAVGDKEFFAEGGCAFAAGGGDDDIGGEAGEIAPALLILLREDEGNEGGAALDDVDAELPGDVVAEAGRAHLGDREATGGEDERLGAPYAACGLDDVHRGLVPLYGEDGRAEHELDTCRGALFREHRDDLLRGAVAEELAEGFLVIGDAVLLDESDEVRGGVAGEGGFGEVRVFGEEVFGAGVEVGEVAPASAGDEDFLAGEVCVVEQGDAAAATSGFDGAHQTGGACSDDEDVDLALVHGAPRCCSGSDQDNGAGWCAGGADLGWEIEGGEIDGDGADGS